MSNVGTVGALEPFHENLKFSNVNGKQIQRRKVYIVEAFFVFYIEKRSWAR
jgi:hypothetical protein